LKNYQKESIILLSNFATTRDSQQPIKFSINNFNHLSMKKLLQSLLLLLFIAFQAIGQERTVTGTVTDKSDGLPLPGVSILVKGTTVGTQTSG